MPNKAMKSSLLGLTSVVQASGGTRNRTNTGKIERYAWFFLSPRRACLSAFRLVKAVDTKDEGLQGIFREGTALKSYNPKRENGQLAQWVLKKSDENALETGVGALAPWSAEEKNFELWSQAPTLGLTNFKHYCTTR
ncbi:hypothetical protein BJX65DRAFT_18706 [Aspergillus insuetus]